MIINLKSSFQGERSFSVYTQSSQVKNSNLNLKMARSLLAWVARAALFIVMILQYISFASYPARYEKKNGWQAFLLPYIPSLTLWFIVVCNDNLIPWISSVWGLYVWLALVPIIGVIFGRIEDKIKKDFLPNSASFVAVS